jgi:putative transposase
VDLGLKNLAVLSTGESILHPKFLRASETKIKIIQREVSRKKKGSNNRRKCARRLAKAHRRVERRRDDFLHKASRALSMKADAIVFENLNINGMLKNHHLAKSISDVSWGKLMQFTHYKAASAGGAVYYVNPSGTSQICSRCGETVKKSLSERNHKCPNCGFSSDRDINAALNILGRLPADSRKLLKTPVETMPLPPSYRTASNVGEAGGPAPDAFMQGLAIRQP